MCREIHPAGIRLPLHPSFTMSRHVYAGPSRTKPTRRGGDGGRHRQISFVLFAHLRLHPLNQSAHLMVLLDFLMELRLECADVPIALLLALHGQP
mmetsp:Transcript_172254/g.418868  ORF Transcript_172254/g.418868 Transcript_172254/m.418868 type:complete len:95 (-) Transcript_172254:1054-1338(-)